MNGKKLAGNIGPKIQNYEIQRSPLLFPRRLSSSLPLLDLLLLLTITFSNRAEEMFVVSVFCLFKTVYSLPPKCRKKKTQHTLTTIVFVLFFSPTLSLSL